MKVWHRFGLLGLCLFVFQNCGAPQALIKQELAYSFGVNTDFFYDIKLVTKSVDDEGRYDFTFDVVVSFARDPGAEVNYTIHYSTLGISGVCLSQTGVAAGVQKHFRSSCLMPKSDDLYIQLNLFGPDNTTLVKEFKF